MPAGAADSMLDPILQKVELAAVRRITNFPDRIVYHDTRFANRLIKNVHIVCDFNQCPPAEKRLTLIAAWVFAAGFDALEVSKADGDFNFSILTGNLDFLHDTLLDGDLTPEERQTIIQVMEELDPIRTYKLPITRTLGDALAMEFVKKKKRRERINQMYQEILLHDTKISKRVWYESLLHILSFFDCHTEYGYLHVRPDLEELRQEIRGEQKKLDVQENELLSTELNISASEIKKLKKKLTNVKGRDDRGIQTLFRTAMSNHYTLNAMVDKKANILLTVNSIILSLTIGGFLGGRQIEVGHPLQEAAVLVLLIGSIISIFISIQAIRPNKTQGHFTEADIRNKKGNLLFYGNFYKMSLKDFEWGMLQVLNDSDYLYTTMTRDMYYLGQVLGRKNRLITLSLNVFLIAISASVILYLSCRCF